MTRGRLRGLLPRGRGEVCEKIRCALGVGRCAENGPLIVLQNGQPVADIGRMILAGLQRKIEVGGQERRAQLGDKFFHGVAFIAEPLASEVTVEPGRVASPVRRLMCQYGIVAFSVAKRFKNGHLNMVGTDVVVRLSAAMAYRRARRGKECFRVIDALNGSRRGATGALYAPAPVNLFGVENRIALQEGDIPSCPSPVASSDSVRLNVEA